MNAQFATPLHTPYILDAMWVEAINTELKRQSPDKPFPIEACVMATYDLMYGRPMAPELYYHTVAECEAYLICYKDGAAAWAAEVDRLNASKGVKPVEVDYQAEFEDLVEGMEEAAFFGGWH